MMSPVVVALLCAVATWDSWRWFVQRVGATPEEALSFGIAALVLLGLALKRAATQGGAFAVPVGPVAALLVLHAAASVWAPSIGAAAVAATALLYVLYRAAFGVSPPPAFFGLVALTMPVLPSLQFVLGYPMRIVSASLTVWLLQAQGVPIARDGTFVTVGGEMVQFDAPCSGVSMLWALVLLVLMAGLSARSGALRLAGMLVLAVAAAIVCNVLRVGSLLFAEAALQARLSDTLHEGIGIVAFALSAAVLVGVLQRWPGVAGREAWR